MKTKKMAAPKSNQQKETGANFSTNYLDLLDRFDGLKETGPGRWISRCPAHEDKSPSLSLKDTGDKLLTHCFSGCRFYDIAHAIGALPQDFFSGGHLDRREFDKKHRVPWRDAVEALRHEMWVLQIVAAQLKHGPLSSADHERLVQAGARIEAVWRACNG